MSSTVMVLVNGEALAGKDELTSINLQRGNAEILAAQLKPILTSQHKLIVTYGNRPQIGYVLLRSEVARHVLHPLPLDVCGAQTQGATGYLLSQAFMNILIQQKFDRNVVSLITQSLIDTDIPELEVSLCGVGPWFDQNKAHQYRQIRGWNIIQEPGRGYRRAVPSYPVKEIIEIMGIKYLVEAGYIVVAGGGGGVPVARGQSGCLEGVEIVIETEQYACLMASKIGVDVILAVIENDHKYRLAGISITTPNYLMLRTVDEILDQNAPTSRSVKRLLAMSSDFLHQGGQYVIITTQDNIAKTLRGESGLWLGVQTTSMDRISIDKVSKRLVSQPD
jgi:carbamate kinase